MASEDVIELGSSDEEAEPAPKRVKTMPKNMPNAMVHIPNKLPGVTIKSTSKPLLNPIRKLMGKPVTITKVNAHENRSSKTTSKPQLPSIKSVKTYVGKTVNVNVQRSVQRPSIQLPKTALTTLNLVKKLNNPEIQINRVAKVQKPLYPPVRILNHGLNFNEKLKVVGNLSPIISKVCSVNNKKRRKIPVKSAVTTVELDDEEVPTTSTAGPQWYLRPEDSTGNEMEKANNAEPEPPKLIEITIEDSPIKPSLNKRTNEVGAELAITIDDSPVKSTAKATRSARSETDKTENVSKVPHSKKQLKYQKETVNQTTIEIELEPIFPQKLHDNQASASTADNNESTPVIEDVVEVIESPAKKVKSNPSTPKKASSPGHSKVITSLESISEEFHPVYQEFIDLCLRLENSNDMKVIVEKKIKSYHRQVPKEYTESEEFIDMVQSKIIAMKAGPEKLYLYIKDIVDELNLQRKMVKANPPVKENKEIEAEKFQYGEDSEFDSKRQRQIRKLEKTLKKLHRAIQKLEEQEVDFDDEEDSVYLLTERYKERMVRVHAKFCQLTNTKMPSEPRIQIDPRPGQPAGPAKRLEKWVNKKVPIGKPLPFPDFHDVLRCVRDANDQDKLGLNEADIMEEARDLFTRCGKKLQRRRQENEWRLAASRVASAIDPAEGSDELKKKLESNKQLGHTKEADIFNKFADKQNLLKLEAVEIGDKEAEESPVESEDDDVVEEGTTMKDKEKRKERLRRLIQEKSKKTVDNQETKPKEPTTNKEGEIIKKDIKETIVNKETATTANKDDMEKIDVEMVSKDGVVETNETEEIVHSISGDSVNSDIDELHLLQKLHSDEINTSTVESSDSDSPIDISDNLQSSGDNKGKINSDVISIENSSYSESEAEEDNEIMEVVDVANIELADSDPLANEIACSSADTMNEANIELTDSDPLANEIACSSADAIKEANMELTDNDPLENEMVCSFADASKNTENEGVENVLLQRSASGETSKNINDSAKNNSGGVNLKDDAISIGETEIQDNSSRKETIIEHSNMNTNGKESDNNFAEGNISRCNKIESSDKVTKNLELAVGKDEVIITEKQQPENKGKINNDNVLPRDKEEGKNEQTQSFDNSKRQQLEDTAQENDADALACIEEKEEKDASALDDITKQKQDRTVKLNNVGVCEETEDQKQESNPFDDIKKRLIQMENGVAKPNLKLDFAELDSETRSVTNNDIHEGSTDIKKGQDLSSEPMEIEQTENIEDSNKSTTDIIIKDVDLEIQDEIASNNSIDNSKSLETMLEEFKTDLDMDDPKAASSKEET